MAHHVQVMSDNKNESNWTRREVGALWLKLSKDKSQKYMTGHIQTSLEGKIDIVVFSNKDKKTDKAPDFRVYLSEKKSETAVPNVPVKRDASQAQSKPQQGALDDEGVL